MCLVRASRSEESLKKKSKQLEGLLRESRLTEAVGQLAIAKMYDDPNQTPNGSLAKGGIFVETRKKSIRACQPH